MRWQFGHSVLHAGTSPAGAVKQCLIYEHLVSDATVRPCPVEHVFVWEALAYVGSAIVGQVPAPVVLANM